MDKKSGHSKYVILGIVLSIGVIVGPMSFPGFAAGTAENIEETQTTETNRTTDQVLLSPGESTTITVNVSLEEAQELFIEEKFNPAFADIQFVDAGGADFREIDSANENLIIQWFEPVDSVTFSYEVTVPANASDGETFTIDSSANSDIDVGSTTIEVDEEPAFFNVADVSPTNLEIDAGETFNISSVVNNTGGSTGEQTVTLFVNDLEREKSTIQLGAGQKETVTFTDITAPEDPGIYDYTITTDDDEMGASFEVVGTNETSAERSIENTVLSPGANTTVTVTTTVAVDAEFFIADETFSPAVASTEFSAYQVNGEDRFPNSVLADADSFSTFEDGGNEIIINSGSEVIVKYDIVAPDETGEHTIEGEVTLETPDGTEITANPGTDKINVTDQEPPNFVVESIEAPSNVSQGDNLLINATVTNSGETEATQTVEYRLNDTKRANKSLSLTAGETSDVQFNISTDSIRPGTYNQEIVSEDTNKTGTITIKRGIATYQNQNGDTTTDLLRDAISDWRENLIETELLRDVIQNWRAG